MTLKDVISNDLSIFFNLEEIAEEHTVNGLPVVAIVCNNLINNKNAINYYDKEVGIKTSDLSAIPGNYEKESIIIIDNVSYKIKNIDNCEGLTTLQLTTDIENLGLTTVVKYRNKFGTGANQDLGIPGTKTDWNSASSLTYTYFDQITSNFELKDIGIITQGDIQLRVLKSQYNEADLITYEYLINSKVYSLKNNKIVDENNWYTLFLSQNNA